MAKPEWIGTTNGNAGTGTNWSTGAAPASGDTARFGMGTSVISQGIDAGLDQSAVDPAAIQVGLKQSGSIGSEANPLRYGAVSGTLYVENDAATKIALRVTSAAKVVVARTHTNSGSFYFHTGTATEFHVEGGTGAKIGAAATATTTFIRPKTTLPCELRLESGATLTTINQHGGGVICEAAATTINVIAGVWYHQGTSTYDVTTVNVYPGAKFIFNSRGATLTAVNLLGEGAELEASQDSGAKTITTLTVYEGCIVDLDNGVNSVAVTNAVVFRGNPARAKWGAVRSATLAAVP